ncbi:DUF4239 domain-containing protein [Streptomyces niveiscabiei]|uniref:bestrophin-like domain n=1 Tax=Streptomyces niveiscabiei TaxID=164115 RepID=UPI0029ABFB28|nr:hypothetical protein [Streptomyces niveiscabiei]MDX3386029.1 DUF4239 domain-containing protein [Streptomyces niveiscabiei]
MTQTLVICFGVALLAAAVVLLKDRFWPPDPDEEPREDVAEYIAMMVGVLYALILGLSLVSVWDTHSGASDHVATEASAVHQVRLLAESLPEPQASDVRSGADTYVRHVTRVEWPAMKEGQPLGAEGWRLLDSLRAANRLPDSAPASGQAVSQEVLAQLSTLDDARRGREGDTGGGLSPILWLGLIIGGVLTVAFMFMFGVERSFTHVAMAMGLAALITFLVLLIHQLDQPFNGILAVDATPFTRYFPLSSP